MKLTDLSPEWLTPDLFIFKNPTGGEHWLSCPRVRMEHGEQHDLFEEKYPDRVIVGANPDHLWKYEGSDFATMTVTPSIDASKSGNWHGFITNGEIT